MTANDEGPRNSKVKELVERFERWEREENAKKKQVRSYSQDFNTDGLPPSTPRGQVRRLRDQLEAKTKIQESGTLIPARKNDNLRRVTTSYYVPKEEDPDPVVEDTVQSTTTETQEPYVHVDAYWDEETQAYWYQSEDGRWLVYDDISQVFVDPVESKKPLGLSDQVVASVNRQQTDSPIRSSPNPKNIPMEGGKAQFGGLSPTRSPSKINMKEIDHPSTLEFHTPEPPVRTDSQYDDLSSVTGDKPEADEKINGTTFVGLNSALAQVSACVNVPTGILRKFHLGIQLYALVKSNGGMLKPIIIHLAVDRGKIYIVRQGRSRFLTIRHFAECDYSPSCIDFMDKDNNRTTGGMKQTIQGLRQQPLVVLWTSPHFTKKGSTTTSNDKKEESGSKGMAFVFDNRNLRAEFILVLKAMVDYWLVPKKIDFVFKEKDDDEALTPRSPPKI